MNSSHGAIQKLCLLIADSRPKIPCMDWPLYWRLPSQGEAGKDQILDRFLDFIVSKNLELYPAQEEAILELIDGKNVILNTPTGSGKSLVAMALHFQSLALRRRSFYTCPIKALVNEKFRDLCQYFGPDQVGMITGDGGVNQQAPIICCTAEILSNMALREGDKARVDDVVMDEFHYYSDKQRGVAWQIPLLTLPQTRFLLMSATLGDMEFFAKSMTRLNQRPTAIVESNDRPVPLNFEYRETPLHETVADLVEGGQSPIYLVNFSQREAAEQAQNLLSVDFSTKDEKRKIADELIGVKFQSPYGKEMQKLLRHGVGLHHAGLLPKYRVLVERLAQQGMLKVISGTDTLGVGVNVPIRTVLFTKLCKYDGDKTMILSARDFKQISGRAGRRGFDTLGTVVAQAPEHVIENLKMKSKAEGDPKKMRKIVLKTPPPKGFVMWTQETFQKLITSKPEALVSHFQISHGMLLNVLSRQDDGCRAMQRLIRDSHGDAKNKKQLRKKGFEFFRSLLDRKIVEFISLDNGRSGVRVNIELQDDFSLNQTLSLYLLDTILVLKKEDPDYALDLLTLVESVLESPDLILRKQLDRVKTEKMLEMKMAGLKYEERMEELEKLEYPKPNRDFIYATFNAFAAAHPWVGEENIRPKSIAREMYENFHSFAEYIREYDLQRVEGLLLRYISEVYKVLIQTVPDAAKNDEVRAIAIYFGVMVQNVDSSLIEDWEKMRRVGDQNFTTGQVEKKAVVEEENLDIFSPAVNDVTKNVRSFTLLVRNEVHSFVRALASKDYEAALALVQSESGDLSGGWTAALVEKSVQEYLQDHQRICIDPAARHPARTSIVMESLVWKVEQRLIDPEGHNDWAVQLIVDLQASRESSCVVMSLVGIAPVGA